MAIDHSTAHDARDAALQRPVSGSDEPAAFNLPRARGIACLEAAWEIDALARALPGLVPADEHQAHFVARGVCARMSRLAEAIMQGIDDDAVNTRTLRRVVLFGEVPATDDSN